MLKQILNVSWGYVVLSLVVFLIGWIIAGPVKANFTWNAITGAGLFLSIVWAGWKASTPK